MDQQVKKPWQSKTVIVNALAGLGAILALFIPGAEMWTAEHADKIVLVLSFANLVLRVVTKDKISLKD